MDNNTYWKYFLTLENDLLNIQRFVEFDEENFNTFSIEFVRLLLSIGSEVDIVCKLLCREIDNNSNPGNINDYRNIITSRFPEIYTVSINIPIMGIDITPWSKWEGGINPVWWKAYNDVKHERNSFYHSASLENTLNSISSLFVINLYYYKMISVNPMGDVPKLLYIREIPEEIRLGGMPNLPGFENG